MILKQTPRYDLASSHVVLSTEGEILHPIPLVGFRITENSLKLSAWCCVSVRMHIVMRTGASWSLECQGAPWNKRVMAFILWLFQLGFSPIPQPEGRNSVGFKYHCSSSSQTPCLTHRTCSLRICQSRDGGRKEESLGKWKSKGRRLGLGIQIWVFQFLE